MNIGSKIKHLRTQKGLTLAELASRCELTKGFLSQLERDLTSPSIATLSDILEALGTNLSEFFREDKNEKFVFKAPDFFVDEQESCTIHWIVPTPRKIRWSLCCWSCPWAAHPSRCSPIPGRSSAMSSRAG